MSLTTLHAATASLATQAIATASALDTVGADLPEALANLKDAEGRCRSRLLGFKQSIEDVLASLTGLAHDLAGDIVNLIEVPVPAPAQAHPSLAETVIVPHSAPAPVELPAPIAERMAAPLPEAPGSNCPDCKGPSGRTSHVDGCCEACVGRRLSALSEPEQTYGPFAPAGEDTVGAAIGTPTSNGRARKARAPKK